MKDKKLSHRSNAISLRVQLLRECEAMAQYAFTSGLKVPGVLAQRLEDCAVQELDEQGILTEARVDAPSSGDREIADRTARQEQPENTVQQLAVIHGQLTEVVAPAKPRTILLLSTEAGQGGFWRFLGPVPLIRRMMLMAILSLIGLIAIGLSAHVDGDPQNFSLLHNDGISLLLNQLFLLSASAIGASFAALFEANRYIRDGTFDPVHESSYWVRFVLGLLAGTMLGTLIPIESYVAAANEGQSVSATFHGLGQPILALLGGFSAALVYRILNRLVAAVDSLVRGDMRHMIAAQELAAKARMAEQSTQNRLQLSAMLRKLQQQLSTAADPEELRRELDRIQGELIIPGSYLYQDEKDAGPPAAQQEQKAAVKTSSDPQGT